jgi:hypothetical protein
MDKDGANGAPAQERGDERGGVSPALQKQEWRRTLQKIISGQEAAATRKALTPRRTPEGNKSLAPGMEI